MALSYFRPNSFRLLLSKANLSRSATSNVDHSYGQELTRTEAVGTPQERTITTEWHADYRLSVKITEYAYDAQGRQLSKNVRDIQ